MPNYGRKQCVFPIRNLQEFRLRFSIQYNLCMRFVVTPQNSSVCGCFYYSPKIVFNQNTKVRTSNKFFYSSVSHIWLLLVHRVPCWPHDLRTRYKILPPTDSFFVFCIFNVSCQEIQALHTYN